MNSMMTKSLSYLTFWLLLKAGFLIFIILYAGIGLGPDEAQYWTWSRKLDWGYYSKPPGIAWTIWSGTQIFGHTELGVRFPFILLGFGLALAVYLLAYRSTRNIKVAFWSALLFAFSPLGFFSSFLAITDVGLALFWTLACAILAEALFQEKAPHYPLLGLTIFLGALFKWPIYLMWVILFVLLFFYKTWRKPSKIALEMVISLLGLLPSLIWNVQHGWVTFRHVWSTIQVPVEAQVVSKGNFWDFLGAQAILVSPVLFILMLISFFYLIRFKKMAPPSLQFLGWLSVIFLGGFLGISIFKKMQGNWVDFIYPGAFVFMTWFFMEYQKKEKWLRVGLAVSLVLCSVTFGISFYQRSDLPKIPYGISPFKHNVGWDQLGKILKAVGYQPDRNFLVGEKYQTASLLSFYAPQQKNAYFINIHGLRKNQFSFWPSLAQEQKGKNGFFVAIENKPANLEAKLKLKEFYLQKLPDYFEKVEFLGFYPLFKNQGEVVKEALIFRVINHNGKLPQDPAIY